MPKILTIANKLISLKGGMYINNEHGSLEYEAIGELAIISPTWRVFKEKKEVAKIRRRVFSWAPTWVIDCGEDSFHIKRKLFSWTRQYYTKGGVNDGAIINGNFWDLSFNISKHNKSIATATGKMMTIRDFHKIEVLGDDELFVVVAMVVLHLDRLTEESN